eukprot:1140728-Pelagomonas_calceolata.AAC.2
MEVQEWRKFNLRWVTSLFVASITMPPIMIMGSERLRKTSLPSPTACIKERSPVLKGRAPPHRPRERASTEVYSTKLVLKDSSSHLSCRGKNEGCAPHQPSIH